MSSETTPSPPSGKILDLPPEVLVDETKETITAHLEAIVYILIAGLNARNMDTSRNEAFARFMDPEFVAVPSAPGPQISMNLATYLSHVQMAAQKHAHGRYKILDCDTTIGLRAGTEAEVYINHEITGIPEGVTRRGVGLFRFRRDQMSEGGRWRCFSYQSAAGLDGGVGV